MQFFDQVEAKVLAVVVDVFVAPALDKGGISSLLVHASGSTGTLDSRDGASSVADVDGLEHQGVVFLPPRRTAQPLVRFDPDVYEKPVGEVAIIVREEQTPMPLFSTLDYAVETLGAAVTLRQHLCGWRIRGNEEESSSRETAVIWLIANRSCWPLACDSGLGVCCSWMGLGIQPHLRQNRRPSCSLKTGSESKNRYLCLGRRRRITPTCKS